MGPHPKDIFGPEPSFTEVEKQWEDAAPDIHTGGEWITLGLFAVILIAMGIHGYKVLKNK